VAAVENSSNILLNKFPGIKIQGIVADFLTQLEFIPKGTKKMICFLGSTIGNFSIEEALQFLIDINQIMQPDDMLLLGFDMIKNKDVLEIAYNDSEKVTERFNKNILNVVNNLIGTDFDTDYFKHVAFYNEEFSRIEMHLEAIKDLEINCPGLSSNIFLKKGERIHTENSHKFTIADIISLSSNAGFDIQNVFTDEKKWFSLVHLIKK
jgi:L-histidine N-alpha-methyltransferase